MESWRKRHCWRRGENTPRFLGTGKDGNFVLGEKCGLPNHGESPTDHLSGVPKTEKSSTSVSAWPPRIRFGGRDYREEQDDEIQVEVWRVLVTVRKNVATECGENSSLATVCLITSAGPSIDKRGTG